MKTILDAPPEIIDLIISFTIPLSYRYHGQQRKSDLYFQDRETLRTLRLVNHTFCQAATPLLFKKIVLHYDGTLQNLLRISNSRYVAMVRQISIQTGVHVDCLETFPDDLATNLPVCLKSLPNLQTLSISDLVFSHPQSSARSAKIEQYLMTAIQAILHHARLDNLEDLRLRLPLTYDFATLAKAPLPDEQSKPGNDLPTVMRRLRHLKVGISDTSGPGGHMIYFDPPTMSQAQWPNVRYAREFFGFLEMAPNIHSLEVSCTHKLDMDKLNVVKFQNLRKLCLNRLTVSPEHLQTLLSQNQTAIRALRLNAIGLKDGTWEEIFISLCSFPRLTQFWVEYCGYDPRGASSGFIDPSITPYDIAKDLVSVHRGDFDALGDLQRHVMRLRDAARLTQISREVYQWGFMPSLDSATSHE